MRWRIIERRNEKLRNQLPALPRFEIVVIRRTRIRQILHPRLAPLSHRPVLPLRRREDASLLRLHPVKREVRALRVVILHRRHMLYKRPAQ